MSSVVRIVKREERERANNSPSEDGSRVPAVQQTTPEMIIKSWITMSRERRRAEAADYLLDFKRWEESTNVSLYQRPAIKVFLSVLILTAFLCSNDPRVAAKSIARDKAKHSTLSRSMVEEHFVTVESVRVHYIETGTGRTVVMIHGNAGSVEDFEFGTLALLSSEYHVVAIDRPGHGSSDRPARKTATVEFQAELLHRTLSSLGITQSILIGHSWGAALALAYALKYPQEVFSNGAARAGCIPRRRWKRSVAGGDRNTSHR